MTAVEWLAEKVIKFHNWKLNQVFDENCFDEIELNKAIQQAKEMDKEQKQRFNKFLNDEMELGISDKKTIERIQWYYNNYLLTFKSE